MKIRKLKNKIVLKNIFILAITTALVFTQCKEPAGLNAIVVSDQSKESNKDIKTILENTGLFDVDIKEGGSPDFTGYDVVVLNADKGNWDESAKEAFAGYVKNGGGVVVLGNAGSAFSGWTEYQKIVGLTSDKSSGRSNEAYNYPVVNVNAEHPITKGLNKTWLHSDDFLLYRTASPGGDVEVLSTALADSIHGGNGKSLSVLFTVQFGEGRVLHSTLGNNSGNSMRCVGFITTLQRGAEWAATGMVSQEVPLDFPNYVSAHSWPDFKPLTLDEIFEKASVYKVGKSRKYLADISKRIRNSDGEPETYAMYEGKILEFLNSDATVDSKKYLCKELSWIGSDKSANALGKLVNDKDLSEAASYVLQRLRL